ncbi:MAG: hypothetical protein KatS3mg012_0294 [Gaiellaceae bacterium]|nr:MAG: hypothetical protein KatS3mg012_0294 [Gaiellaceae bacterium]
MTSWYIGRSALRTLVAAMRRRQPQVTPFAIFSTPRTGSSWLVELLNSHPAITCFGERFYEGRGVPRDNGDRGFVRFDDLPTRFARRIPRVEELELDLYLRLLYRSRPRSRAVGLKVMLENTRRRPTLLDALARRQSRIVHLVRRNTLAKLISLRVAVARGVFRARVGDTLLQVTVRLKPEKLARDLDRMEAEVAKSRELLAHHRFPTLEVSYEDLVARTTSELARIATFLGLATKPWPAETTLVVTSPRPLDLVANREEVRRALAGTRYAAMLEELEALEAGRCLT